MDIRSIVKDNTPASAVAVHVVQHLLKQKVQSGDGEQCLYHGPAGRSCAVGCLIPKSVNTKEVEGQPYYSAIDTLYGSAMGHDFGSERGAVLDLMQTVHDRAGARTFSKRYMLAAIAEEVNGHLGEYDTKEARETLATVRKAIRDA